MKTKLFSILILIGALATAQASLYIQTGTGVSGSGFDGGTQSGVGTFNQTIADGNPAGTWTLFFADVTAGGGNATLNGWSLDITAVPEPVNMAAGIFGVVLVGTSALCRYFKQRKAILS